MKAFAIGIALVCVTGVGWAQDGTAHGHRPVISLDVKHGEELVGQGTRVLAPSLLVRPNAAGCVADAAGDRYTGTARQNSAVCATPFPDGTGAGHPK